MWTVYFDLPGSGSNSVALYPTSGKAVGGMYEAASDCGCFENAFVRVPTSGELDAMQQGDTKAVPYMVDGKPHVVWYVMRVSE